MGRTLTEQTVEFKHVQGAQFGVHLVLNTKKSEQDTKNPGKRAVTELPTETGQKQKFQREEFIDGPTGLNFSTNTTEIDDFSSIKGAQFGVHLVVNDKQSNVLTVLPTGTRIKQTFKGEEFVGGQIGINCSMSQIGDESKPSWSSVAGLLENPDHPVNTEVLVEKFSQCTIASKPEEKQGVETNCCKRVFGPIRRALYGPGKN